MADTQYDVSEKVYKLFQIKQEQKQKTKAYFAKYMQNPHRPLGDVEPFDPVLFRYSAMQSYQAEYYKPKPAALFFSLAVVFVPVIALTCILHNVRYKKESRLRSGLVAYKDRSSKTVL